MICYVTPLHCILCYTYLYVEDLSLIVIFPSTYIENKKEKKKVTKLRLSLDIVTYGCNRRNSALGVRLLLLAVGSLQVVKVVFGLPCHGPEA